MDGLGDLGDLMTRLGTMLGRREDTHCFQCDQPDSKLKCARCRAAVYCSRACQKSHWKEHKAICNAMTSGDTDVVAHGHFFVRDGDYFHSVLIRPGTPLSFHIPTETWTMASSPDGGAIPLFPLNYCGGSDPVVLYAP